MIEPFKHYAVNWVDGMKISRDHFVQQENYFIDSIRDSNSISVVPFNYGLLPISEQFPDKTIYEIHHTATNDTQLFIKKITAVTMGGYRLEISDYKTNIRNIATNTALNQEEIDGQFYILATVNPFDKIPFGEIDTEEIPPRHPHTKPNYRIELVETSILNSNYSGGNYLVLGKVGIKLGMAQIDNNFIPPCTSVQSHPKLLEYYQNYSTSMSNIRSYAFKIIQKIAHKNQNNELAHNIKTICRTIIHHEGEHYFAFKNMATHLPPIFLMNIFSKLALKLYHDTQLMPAAELEEMLNYCLEWSDVAPHTLLNLLSGVAEINYNHHDSGQVFFNIQMMLKNLEQILSKLSELDYIGQRKENIIVNEQEIKSTIDPKKGWSVLD